MPFRVEVFRQSRFVGFEIIAVFPFRTRSRVVPMRGLTRRLPLKMRLKALAVLKGEVGKLGRFFVPVKTKTQGKRRAANPFNGHTNLKER